MELTAFQMYLILMLDNIGTFCLIMGFLVFTLFLVFSGITMETKPPKDAFSVIKKKGAIVGIVLISLIFIAHFVPNTKQMAAIIVVPKIVNNEKVQQLPEELLNLGMEWLEELKPKKEAE